MFTANVSCQRVRARRLLVAVAAAIILAVPAAGQQWTTSGNNIYNANTGNVGIGTTAPTSKLDVVTGGIYGGDDVAGFAGLPGGSLSLMRANYPSSIYVGQSATAYGQLQWVYNATPALAYLRFGTEGSHPFALQVDGGNLGIGTATPVAKLDVLGNTNITGNVTVSGNIAAKYQDVAEWVTATETMEPGTVVVLNPDKPNEVMPATRAYDTTVAGVVSANPGLILGESAASKAQIATAGRVRVKVSATRQPIHIGDLLVTSGKTGVAMKSEPMEIRGRAFHQPGTIIGKALEPLGSGEGEILVLLSLQ